MRVLDVSMSSWSQSQKQSCARRRLLEWQPVEKRQLQMKRVRARCDPPASSFHIVHFISSGCFISNIKLCSHIDVSPSMSRSYSNTGSHCAHWRHSSALHLHHWTK